MAKLLTDDGEAAPGQGTGEAAAEMDADDKAFAQRMMEDGAPGDRPAAATPPPAPAEAGAGAGEEGEDDPDKPKAGEEDEDDDKGDDKGKHPTLTPEQQKAWDKRIGKEVRKRKELEETLEEEREQAAELRAQLEDVRKAAPAAQGAERVLLAESEGEIDTREDFLTEVIDFCEENRGEDVVDEKTGDVQYTAAQVTERLRAARRELRLIPRARRALEQRERENAEAAKVWPELADESTPLSKQVKATLRATPALRALPGARLLVADALAMRAQREKRAAGKPAARTPPAPAAPMPTGGNRGPTDRSGKKASFETFVEGGYTDDALATALGG